LLLIHTNTILSIIVQPQHLQTTATLHVFDRMASRLDREVATAAKAATPAAAAKARGEQVLLQLLIDASHRAVAKSTATKPSSSSSLSSSSTSSMLAPVRLRYLSPLKYVSGQWYDESVCGDNVALRAAAGNDVVIINSNWIVNTPPLAAAAAAGVAASDEPKVARARRWGHWFLASGGNDSDSGDSGDSVQCVAAQTPLLHTLTLRPPLSSSSSSSSFKVDRSLCLFTPAENASVYVALAIDEKMKSGVGEETKAAMPTTPPTPPTPSTPAPTPTSKASPIPTPTELSPTPIKVSSLPLLVRSIRHKRRRSVRAEEAAQKKRK
jgi:hypothetical protein